MNDYHRMELREARRIVRVAERRFAKDGNRESYRAAMEKSAKIAMEARKDDRV